jgi:hypothetical protein
VPIVRGAWAAGVMSYHARHYMPLLPEDSSPVVLTCTREPPVVAAGGSGVCRAGA